jgi:hypothetical protein
VQLLNAALLALFLGIYIHIHICHYLSPTQHNNTLPHFATLPNTEERQHQRIARELQLSTMYLHNILNQQSI